MWTAILSFASGAAVVALVSFFGPPILEEAREYLRARREARRVFAEQLDPLLKAADELYGKLLSLAKEDFTEFRTSTSAVDLCSTLFLFAQLWARIEILRRESLHADLVRERRGALILKFVRTLESRQVRLVDRAWQRAIGESLISGGSTSEIRPFKDFVESYESEERLRAWFNPLAVNLLKSASEKKTRQRILRYGVVVHAMIETLDPKHHTTKPRPGYPNKLSRRSRRDLTGRVFRLYLPEVGGPQTYTEVVSTARAIKKGQPL